MLEIIETESAETTPDECHEAVLTVVLVVVLWWILMMLCMGGLVVESLMKGMK